MSITKHTYADSLRWRIRLWRCVIVLQLIWMVVVGETGGDSRIQTPLAESLGRILFFGGMIYAVTRIYTHKKTLADRLLMKEKALLEHDERNRMLHICSGGIVMDVMLVLLYIATTTAAQFSMDAFHTALALFAAAIVLKAGMYQAYSRGWLHH